MSDSITNRFPQFPRHMTIGEKYRPAMELDDEGAAHDYFERCVEHTMFWHGKTREEAEQLERGNLGYFAGYYNSETRERVERLFKCAHPIFGGIAENGPPSAGDALLKGVRAGTGI